MHGIQSLGPMMGTHSNGGGMTEDMAVGCHLICGFQVRHTPHDSLTSPLLSLWLRLFHNPCGNGDAVPPLVAADVTSTSMALTAASIRGLVPIALISVAFTMRLRESSTTILSRIRRLVRCGGLLCNVRNCSIRRAHITTVFALGTGSALIRSLIHAP